LVLVTKQLGDKVSFNFISPRNNLNKPSLAEITTPEAYFCYNTRFFSDSEAKTYGRQACNVRNSKKPNKFIFQITVYKKSYFYRVKILIRGERNYIRLKGNIESKIVCI